MRVETARLLDEVETSVRRKFRLREDIGLLIDAGVAAHKEEVLDEAAFVAKFLTKANEVLRREGLSSDETKNMAKEFEAKLGTLAQHIASLSGGLDAAGRRAMSERYLSMTQDGLKNLLSLAEELSWLKNFMLDTRSGRQGAI